MSSDAIRRVARKLIAGIEGVRNPEFIAIRRLVADSFIDLADELDAEAPEPQPASADDRDILATMATFCELQAAECHPTWRHHDTAIRLAAEARAALARPVAGPPDCHETLRLKQVVEHQTGIIENLENKVAIGERYRVAAENRPDIVGELVGVCLAAKSVIDTVARCSVLNRPLASELSIRLAGVIARAKGQSHD